MNYINEFDPNAAAWMRQLIEDGIIPKAHVDERSITEVTPSDLAGYVQCHWFAGIAGWPLALKLAGWPEDRPVWTASLPCQPFSSAGKQAGTDDERHLWPVFQRLVSECRPPAIFGEQVASKIAREKWFPGVCLDLQAMGYPVTALDLCAPLAGEDGEGRLVRGDQETWERIVIGAPHIRQRLYWVAYRGVADSDGSGSLDGIDPAHGRRTAATTERGSDHRMANTESRRREDGQTLGRSDAAVEGQTGIGERVSGGSEITTDHRMANTEDVRWGEGVTNTGGLSEGDRPQGTTGRPTQHSDSPSRMANSPSDRRERSGQGAEAEEGRQPRPQLGGELPSGSEGRGLHSGMAYSRSEGREGRVGGGASGEEGQPDRYTGECRGDSRVGDTGSEGSQGHAGNVGDGSEPGRQHQEQARPTGSASWTDFDLIPCRDGKARRTKRSLQCLVAGLPRGVVPSCDPGAPGYANETSEARVMRLKGYGNAINAPLAAMFIETCMEVIPHE